MAYVLKYSGQEADEALGKALTAVQPNSDPVFKKIYLNSGSGPSIEQGEYENEIVFSSDADTVLLKNLSDPIEDNDAATKYYVEKKISENTAVILDFFNNTPYIVPDEDYAKLQSGNCIVYFKIYKDTTKIQLLRDNNSDSSDKIEYIGYLSENFSDPIRVSITTSKIATFQEVPAYNKIGLSKIQKQKANNSVIIQNTNLNKYLFLDDNIITQLPSSSSNLSWDMFVIGTVTLPTLTGANIYEFIGMEIPSDLKLTAGFYKMVLYHNTISGTTYAIYKLA